MLVGRSLQLQAYIRRRGDFHQNPSYQVVVAVVTLTCIDLILPQSQHQQY